MNCIICSDPNSKIIYKNYPGYVEGTFFDIYSCSKCCTHFIDPGAIDESIYERIYSSKNHFGYDRYADYIDIAKSEADPVSVLAKIDSVYYAVDQYIKQNKVDKILEVGCGYGYLTHGLRKRGFVVTGTDISENAIKNAKQLFGGEFTAVSAEKLNSISDEKFDLIIALEVIEHVKSPVEFVASLKNLLNKNGAILLTTPNKDFSKRAKIWRTAHPPVHMNWLSFNSFKVISKLNDLSCEKISYRNYYPTNENRFVKFFRQGKDIIEPSLMKKNGCQNDYWTKINYSPQWNKNESSLKNSFRIFFHKVKPVRDISNFLYNILIERDITLAVILRIDL